MSAVPTSVAEYRARPIAAPLRALVLADPTPLRLREIIEATPRIDAEYQRPPSWRDCVALGAKRSHDLAIVVPSRRAVWCATVLRQFGWRIVFVAGTADGDVNLPWPGARCASAVFDCRATPTGPPEALPAVANGLAAVAAEAAARPGAGLTGGPPISVVTTVLNEEQGVADLIHQVRAQLQPGDEFIVVDGGSRDRTLDRIKALTILDPQIRCLSAPRTNIPAGRNAGITLARNAVIATTDADCELSADWLEALRRPFAEPDPAGLVAGNCAVAADGAFERAQALACYADPLESRFPSVLVRIYGRLFGCTFDPTLPFGRSLAFSKAAWEQAGGFPEELRWVEDGVFGRRVAQHHRCILASDAIVTWRQRNSLKATVQMYLTYGRGAAQSGDRQLVARDMVRLGAYAGSAVAITRGRRGLLAVLAGGMAYLSVPLTRIVRYRAGVASGLCVPAALAAKDIGKVGGALSTRLFRGPDLRSQWPPWKPPAPEAPHGLEQTDVSGAQPAGTRPARVRPDTVTEHLTGGNGAAGQPDQAAGQSRPARR